MSFRAQRIPHGSRVDSFNWGADYDQHQTPPSVAAPRAAQTGRAVPMPVVPVADRDGLEREAFGQGYAQGERAGAEAAASRSEAVLRRLAETIEELGALRIELIHKTERQVVQLALAMARRIVHREIALDKELLAAMARVALDRLGANANATIRLHPDDYAATLASRTAGGADAIQVVPDPVVRRGGCLIQSDFGLIDVGVDAQVQELTTILFGRDQGADVLGTAEVIVAS
jgi:flagellar assembly protein FliH